MISSRLHDARAKRARGEGGFTLIELLVVVVIIGVLVAIAIPLYLNYRKGAQNKSLESDVRAAVSTVEQCIGENNNTVPPTTQVTGGTKNGEKLTFSCGTTSPQTEIANVGDSNKVVYSVTSTTPVTYVLTGTNGNETVTYTSVDSKTVKANN